MKRLILLLILLSTPLYASDWTKQAETIRREIVYVEFSGMTEDDQPYHGSCTGIVINHDSGYILTAAHCIGEDASSETVEDLIHKPQQALVRVVDEENDLAVISVANLDGKRDIKMEEKVVRVGEPAMAAGYGYGLEDYLIRTGVISHPFLSPTNGLFAGVLTDFGFCPGMSGGPLVNEGGKLIGVVTRSSNDGLIGYAVALPAVRALADRYFAGYVKPSLEQPSK